VLCIGGKVIKNVTEYNLVHSFIGSEGTLGIVTEVTVRLITGTKAFRIALVTRGVRDDRGL
jgi:glycolate oxidase